jgi:hypothetical protein
MLFENFYNANGSADNLHRSMAVAGSVATGHDYSHLVDRPVKPRQEQVKRTDFDGMLTDYDRILLKFGMHILCEC